MQLLKGQWEQKLRRLLQCTEQSVVIISPFITKAASALLRPFLEHRKLTCKVITRFNLNDFFSGVSDHNALRELIGAGATVKALKGLHAKVYIFDRKWAVLTSANFTGGGLTNEHEWGFLVSHDECHEIFEEAEELWRRLANVIQPVDMACIDEDSGSIVPLIVRARLTWKICYLMRGEL